MVNGNTVPQGTPVTVDLGRLRLFSPTPDRTYTGARHGLRGWKEFGFRMPRRAEYSGIRLGYVLAIGGREIRLMAFATAADRTGGDFPAAAIEEDLEIETRVYDCYQSAHVSSAGEDQFEREGRIAGVERLFLNERIGRVKLRVGVTFVPFQGGDPAAYAGEEKVTITALEPEAFPEAAILSVEVRETRVGHSGPEEVVADAMTVHLIPTYVVLGADFFADYYAAVARMAKAVKELDRKAIPQLEVPHGPPDPDPAWKMRARAIEIERGLDRVEDAIAQRNALALDIVAANVVPVARG
jgi:hypothetical protein